MGHYTERFFSQTERQSSEGAAALVRLVLDLVPASKVVDFGCGTGRWLAAFSANGVNDVLGIDGPWVPAHMLRISPEQFEPHDLTEPLDVGRRFDLAVSLEVAEHLPAPSAGHFVSLLVRAAPVVLFSAAVPGQGGTDHVNEQWPDYWAERFATHGYLPIDVLRPAIWNDSRLAAYLRQNLLLYASREAIAASPVLSEARSATDDCRLSIVHPAEFERATDPGRRSLRRAIFELPEVFAGTCRRRVS